jgi:hypothetical protein
MKRTWTIIGVSVLALISLGLWFWIDPGWFLAENLVSLGIILALVAFAVVLGLRTMGDVKRGLPAEDELSKKMMQRASSIAYFVSLYLWVFLIYIQDRVSWDCEMLMGTGVLGMGVIFAGSWLFVYFRGLRNE